MPSEYTLKRPVLDVNRLQKQAKKILDEASDDRNLALESYRYFKEMVDANPNDSVSKAQMVDCLKLAQTSKASSIKVMELLIRVETHKEKQDNKKPAGSMFTELENLTK